MSAARVQTILEIPVRAGAEESLVELFRAEAIFELAARNEGFLGARLLVPSECGRPFVVIAEWADEAAIQRWVDDPARGHLDEPLAAHVEGEPVRRVYAIADAWPPLA